MMKGITPRSRVIYESHLVLGLLSTRQLKIHFLYHSLIYRINNEASSPPNSSSSSSAQQQHRRTKDLFNKTRGIWNVNCYDEQPSSPELSHHQRKQRRVSKIGGQYERWSFLEPQTKGHSENSWQSVCLLWKTESRKHEWGSLEKEGKGVRLQVAVGPQKEWAQYLKYWPC